MNSALETLKSRGFISQCTALDDLSNAMDAGPVTFYVGCDPTGASLHIGHMVPFFAFRHLCAAGHRGIALIGGGTARIGDPSGKTEMRQMLDYERLDRNAEAIRGQLDRFLGGFDGRAVICANNKDWLAGLNYIDFLRVIGSHFSVNRMLSFEAYKKRLETGLSFIEFNYQLLQSYDFVELYCRHNCTLQIGGDDQWGNIVAGIELIRRLGGGRQESKGGEVSPLAAAPADAVSSAAPLPRGQSPLKPPAVQGVFGLTFPLIETSDGKKMGKTERGAIFLDPAITSPYDFFQYWRNVTDADLPRFLRIFTFLPLDECERLAALPNPNEAKEQLAWEVTALIHGKDEAERARAGAKAAFGGGGAREAMPSKRLDRAKIEAGYPLTDLFFDAGLCPTKSEARRLIEQGGAFITRGGVLTAETAASACIGADVLDEQGELIIRAGKKRVCRLVF